MINKIKQLFSKKRVEKQSSKNKTIVINGRSYCTNCELDGECAFCDYWLNGAKQNDK
jgi:hypothetical protein